MSKRRCTGASLSAAMVMSLAAGMAAFACGHGAGSGSLVPPTTHRPMPNACPHTRPPGTAGTTDAGPAGPGMPCHDDGQCATDAGVNGRCEPPMGEMIRTCSYDTCFADSDCGTGSLCACDVSGGNQCVPSNCTVDSDCASGYCSPSPGDLQDCIPAFGQGPPAGYYCHTSSDDCTNDTDCNKSGFGVCAWQATVGKWACVSSTCAG